MGFYVLGALNSDVHQNITVLVDKKYSVPMDSIVLQVDCRIK